MDRDYKELIAAMQRQTEECDELGRQLEVEVAAHCRAIDELLDAARARFAGWPDRKARA